MTAAFFTFAENRFDGTKKKYVAVLLSDAHRFDLRWRRHLRFDFEGTRFVFQQSRRHDSIGLFGNRLWLVSDVSRRQKLGRAEPRKQLKIKN